MRIIRNPLLAILLAAGFLLIWFTMDTAEAHETNTWYFIALAAITLLTLIILLFANIYIVPKAKKELESKAETKWG